MAIEKFEFFSKQSITAFGTALLTKSNIRIEERIVSSITETSTDKQIGSAKAVYDLLNCTFNLLV